MPRAKPPPIRPRPRPHLPRRPSSPSFNHSRKALTLSQNRHTHPMKLAVPHAEFTPGSRIIYNDGHPGHTDVAAEAKLAAVHYSGNHKVLPCSFIAREER